MSVVEPVPIREDRVRFDGRRSGPSGSRRPKPTAATAALAWWQVERLRVSERGRQGERSPERALGVGGSEPAPQSPPRDRERQKLARTVRLPQPMGAGGRRPPVDPGEDPRAASYAAGRSFHG